VKGGGWGHTLFDRDGASNTIEPGTLADHPQKANDARCGFKCHTIVKPRDYVFAKNGKRRDGCPGDLRLSNI